MYAFHNPARDLIEQTISELTPGPFFQGNVFGIACCKMHVHWFITNNMFFLNNLL